MSVHPTIPYSDVIHACKVWSLNVLANAPIRVLAAVRWAEAASAETAGRPKGCLMPLGKFTGLLAYGGISAAGGHQDHLRPPAPRRPDAAPVARPGLRGRYPACGLVARAR